MPFIKMIRKLSFREMMMLEMICNKVVNKS